MNQSREMDKIKNQLTRAASTGFILTLMNA